MDAAGYSSNLCSCHVGEGDDKRSNPKLLPDFTANEVRVNPTCGDSSSTQVKLQRSWSSVKAFVAEHLSHKDLDGSKEVLEPNDFRYVGWNHLRDIALYSLHAFLSTAVETISHEGYAEDAVINAIENSALCYQFDGPITKIEDSARQLLQNDSGQQVDSSLSKNLDTALNMLGFYLLSRAASTLKKSFTFFTWGDALWCILLCDMDLSIAHSFLTNMNAYVSGQSDGLANNQNVSTACGENGCSGTESPLGPALSQSFELQRIWDNALVDFIVSVQKSAGKDQVASSGQDQVASSGQDQVASSAQDQVASSGQDQVDSFGQGKKAASLPRTGVQYVKKSTKGTSSKRSPNKSVQDPSKDHAFFESFQPTKVYGKKSSRKFKESKSVIAFLESAHTVLSGTSKVANTKGLNSSTLVSTLPLSNFSSMKTTDSPTVVSTPPLPSGNQSSSSSYNGRLGTKQQTVPDDLIHFSLPKTPADGHEFYFSHDGMRTTWVPKDRKDELALDLIRRLGELKLEVKVWTDWANDRVVQSTSRLATERTILASLRNEMKESEDCGVLNIKKLEQTERAIRDTSDQLDCADSRILELTNNIKCCKVERKAAMLLENQSDASVADIKRKGNESLEKLKFAEAEVTLLQEALAAENCNLSKLQKNLEQAKRHENEVKKRCQAGEKMVAEVMKRVCFERNELERTEILARTKSSHLLLSAQNEQQRLQASVKHLEQLVDERLELARQDLKEVSCGSKPRSIAKITSPPGFGLDSVRREQECVMCLEEEISVVFLPCRHQIVCVGCNQLHQDQGMTDCPACRSPIKRRICARFADS